MRAPFALLLLLGPAAVAALAAGCSSGSHPASAPTSTPATAAAPTSPSPTGSPTTTVYSPTAPQASPDAAAGALVGYWSQGQVGPAASVASPGAVATLFAQPYPAGYLQARGCTDPSSNPGTCTYANRDSGSLYEITVSRGSTGWYASSVTVES